MANTELTGLRVDPSLIERAARRHGLDVANRSHVLRYALALAAGVENAAEVATLRPGPKVRPA